MSMTIEIDARGFNQAVRDLVANVDKDAKTVMKEEMGLLVQRCIELTPPPHGRGGEAAVSRDIQKVFMSISDMEEIAGSEQSTFEDWIKRVKNPKLKARLEVILATGDLAAMEAFLRNTAFQRYTIAVGVDPAAHQSQRNRRGRVGKVKNRIALFRHETLKPYIKLVMAHVGRAKAGWMAAADRFGTRAIPAWVRRHGTKDGRATIQESPGKIVLEAVNSNKAIGSLDAEARIVQNAIVGRERDIRTKLERIIAWNAKKMFGR